MATMKVMRTIETETTQLEIGDKIKLYLMNNEEHTATAVRREEDGTMLFVFDSIMNREHYMNRPGKQAKYEESDMREYLRESAVLLMPAHIAAHMVRFENGDYLRLLTREEVFGAEDGSGQMPYFKDRKNRAALREGFFEWWWLQDAADAAAAYFAFVYGSGGANYVTAYNNYGVRPAFKIGDL